MFFYLLLKRVLLRSIVPILQLRSLDNVNSWSEEEPGLDKDQAAPGGGISPGGAWQPAASRAISGVSRVWDPELIEPVQIAVFPVA